MLHVFGGFHYGLPETLKCSLDMPLRNEGGKLMFFYPVTLLPIGSGYFRAKPSPGWIPQ